MSARRGDSDRRRRSQTKKKKLKKIKSDCTC